MYIKILLGEGQIREHSPRLTELVFHTLVEIEVARIVLLFKKVLVGIPYIAL